MAGALDLMSVEDSRVMDVSLCSTSTEGVQSTSRSWNCRLLLVAAPFCALVFGYIGVQAHRHVDSATEEKEATLGALFGKKTSGMEEPSFLDFGNKTSGMEEPSFRRILEEIAPPLPEEVSLRDIFKGRSLSWSEERDGICSEESDTPRFLEGFPRRDSDLGKALRKGLVYRFSPHLEPSSPFGQRCRYRSQMDWKFYCDDTSSSETMVVTTALRVMWLAGLNYPEQQEFFDTFKATRPGARMVQNEEEEHLRMRADGNFMGLVRPASFFVGLARPASRARSLWDLVGQMRGPPEKFTVNLARIVRSALSQLPTFYQGTRFGFHGRVSSDRMEVLVDEDKPLMAYVTGYSDAIYSHMLERMSGKQTFGFYAPPEAHKLRKECNKTLMLTSKFDTWSAGVAMVEMLFRAYPEKETEFTMSWNEMFRPVPLENLPRSAKFYDQFYKSSVNFCAAKDRNFAAVIRKMIALNVEDRWDVHQTLTELAKFISKAGENQHGYENLAFAEDGGPEPGETGGVHPAGAPQF